MPDKSFSAERQYRFFEKWGWRKRRWDKWYRFFSNRNPYMKKYFPQVIQDSKWEEIPSETIYLPSIVDGKFHPYKGLCYKLKKDH